MSENLSLYFKRMNSLVNWEDRARSGMDVALAPVRDLVSRMGLPLADLPFVHITGTKGKGSVGSLVEHGLAAAGFRTGRYSSPHVESINERIAIDGHPISDVGMENALAHVFQAYDDAVRDGSDGREATWFDVFTAAALFAFFDHGVAWAVMEVGLGGRLDSTNIIDAKVSVLTNVELEHTEVLGNTREKIAREKLGILKSGGFLVAGVEADDEIAVLVRSVCEATQSGLRFVAIAEAGSVAERNQRLAGEVLDAIGLQGWTSVTDLRRVSRELLSTETIRLAQLPGRSELFHLPADGGAQAPISVVLDAAHVAASIQLLAGELKSSQCLLGPCVVLLAVRPDKDAAAIVSALTTLASVVVCTQLEGDRGSFLASELVALVALAGGSARAHPEIAEAFKEACEIAQSISGWVLVVGSFDLVARVRPSVKDTAMRRW